MNINNKLKLNLKRIIFMLVVMIESCMFTGCTDAIPDLSDEEMKQVEEYAANLLLKYDKNYSSSVLSDEEIQKKKEELEAKAEFDAMVQAQKEAEKLQKEEEKNNANNANNDSNGESGDENITAEPVYANIADFLGFENVTIDLANTVVSANYPADTSANDWQGIATAANGNKLVAYEFNVTNNNSEDYYFDMLSKNVKASIKVNGRITKAPLTTLLNNDFMYYRETISAGESRTLVIIIELSSDDADSVTSSVLTLKYNGEKMETSLY